MQIARLDVDTLLSGPLGTWLAEQTAVREEAKKKASDRLFRALMVVLPLAGVMWVLAPFDAETKFWLTAIPAGLAFAWSQLPKIAAVKQVKIGINQAIANALGLTYECEVQPDERFAKAKSYCLVPKFKRSSFEDCWRGDLGGTPFVLYEAHLEERRGTGKSRRWVTVFRGAIMAFAFGRRFHSTTLVQRAGAHRGLFGGRKDSVTLDGHRLDLVDLVHPGFEDAFDVYSDDQVEAHYLVNPTYVERLIALEQAFAGRNIRALFTGGETIVAIEIGNMFESGSIEASEDRALVARTIEQFGGMAELAAALNEPPR